MKLLGWMHRKFRQDSGEPLKDSALGYTSNCLSGQSSLDEHQYLPKPSYGAKPYRNLQKENLFRKSFTSLDSETIEEEEEYDHEYDSSVPISGFFNGFLTIGTFGSDQVLSEPHTPTFAVSLENVTEKETELTENDMKLINEELEKVLGADAKEDKYTDSSGRTSHVSTITLSGTDHINGRNSSAVCPLQGYLFGTSIDLPEKTTAGKKEQRTSLGELFQKTKLVEDKNDKEDKKEGEKTMKKLLKWPLLRSSTHSSTTDSSVAEKKLQKKLLQIFNRKVHPEGSTAATTKKSTNKAYHKYEGINNTVPYESHGDYYNNGGRIVPDEDFVVSLASQAQHQKQTVALSKEQTRQRRYNSLSNPPPCLLSDSDSNGNRECWIKTDADYLVLEL